MKELPVGQLEALPLVLAGPLLRHTDAAEVSVWLALRSPRRVSLDVQPAEGGDVCLSGTAQTTAFGPHLHLVLVTAAGDPDTLAPGGLYAYRLAFATSDGTPAESFDAAVAGLEKLVYPPHRLPTFMLPPRDIDAVRVIYGSCRKPHGEGRDALPVVDRILARAASGEVVRPQQLLLCGDQIYADDVGDALLRLITRQAQTLVGGGERLPGKVKGRHLLPGRRMRLCRKARLTSRYCKSHVFRFSEFLLHYLMVWSDVLWPEVLPEFDDVYPRRGFFPPLLRGTRFAFHGRLGKRRVLMETAYDVERERLKAFQAGLPAVRRVLANLPSYMIFDDHEITDDWYLNRAWTTRVLQRALGRRMIANGLTAYALCQAWGNTPARFRAGPCADLLRAASDWVADGFDDTGALKLESLLGLPHVRGILRELDRDPETTCAWDFRIYGPCYEVWMLDTRTWRGFPGKRAESIPDLVSGQGWAQFAEPPRPESRVTLIVAPTNVIDVPLTAWASKTAARLMDVYFADYGDSWETQTAAFEDLLAHLARVNGPGRGRFVFLSGDVHYAFATRIQYWGRHPYRGLALEGEADLVLAQLTSSPLCNENFMTRFLHRRGYWPRFPRPAAWAGWNSHPWIAIGSLRGRMKSFYLGFKRRSVRHEPPLLNLEDLPREMEVEQRPDWRYRIDFLRGRRVRGADPRGAGSEIVGVNNVGDIVFDLGDDPDTAGVSQRIWAADDDGRAPLAIHRVPLGHGDARFPKPLLPDEAHPDGEDVSK